MRDPEKLRENQRRYAAAHPEKVRESQLRWAALPENADKIKAWAARRYNLRTGEQRRAKQKTIIQINGLIIYPSSPLYETAKLLKTLKGLAK